MIVEVVRSLGVKKATLSRAVGKKFTDRPTENFNAQSVSGEFDGPTD